jgi:hypothetical protein
MSVGLDLSFPAATPSNPDVSYTLSAGDVGVIAAFNKRQKECAEETAKELAAKLGELRLHNLGELAAFLEDYARGVRAKGICN